VNEATLVAIGIYTLRIVLLGFLFGPTIYHRFRGHYVPGSHCKICGKTAERIKELEEDDAE